MKIIYSLLFLSSILAHSQENAKFYFNSDWTPGYEGNSAFYRVCKIDTLLEYYSGRVTDYYSNGKIYMVGAYLNRQKNGTFTFFHPNGKPAKSGSFKDGKREGVWKEFYPNEIQRNEVKFSGDTFRIIFHNDSTGKRLMENGTGKWREDYLEKGLQVSIEGNYLNGKKNGKWVCKTSEGLLVYEEHYKNDRFIRGIDGFGIKYQASFQNQLLVPYSIEATESFVLLFRNFRKIKQQNTFIGDTSNAVFTIVENPPSYNGGMAAFYNRVGSTIKYPQTARRMGVEGRVYVEFIIERDGSLSEVRVIKGIGAGCDEEAIRVIKEAGNWLPGTQRGKPVRSKFNLAIIFKLD